ncbi:MAG: hypothetical protein GY778_14280 [bacterium]|nr:hypothetical protein [bacterium]
MLCQIIVMTVAALAGVAPAADGKGPRRPDILRTSETTEAVPPAFRFSAADHALLDEVQQACFLYFWREVGAGGLAKDRKKAPVSSIAAVGFQLSALPIGVERGWITREQGRQRAERILHALYPRADNKKFGLYYHFLDYDTGGQSDSGYEVLVSTVDSALFIAGAIPAGEYFGGEIKQLVERIVADANWRAFATGPDGAVSMGWRPASKAEPAGEGEFHDWHWTCASDEERLVCFLAVGAPTPGHALPPEAYYRLRRTIKSHDRMPPFAVSPQGTLFHYFFSHCWIDYRSRGADEPGRLGIDAVRVDWFENSRRAVLTHRQRCIEQSKQYRTLAQDRWGLSACGGRDGYLVPEIRPNEIDKDAWHEGTVAPYAAAAAIMFTPRESLAALRAFRRLEDKHGQPLIWRDPASGGYGFVDAFNLDQGFVSDDYVGIDVGPMLLGIENARTGLIWKLFMQSRTARNAVTRLQLGP